MNTPLESRSFGGAWKNAGAIVLIRIFATAALSTLLLASTAAADDDELIRGQVSADIVSGHKLLLGEGDGASEITLRPNGSMAIEQDDSSTKSKGGLWWVSPAGRLCFTNSDTWSGGVCGDIMIDASGKPVAAKFDNMGGNTVPLEFR